MPRPSIYMNLSSNIAKVERIGKIYFHYAETKRIYVRQDKYSKSREQRQNLFWLCRDHCVYMSLGSNIAKVESKTSNLLVSFAETKRIYEL